MRTIAFEMKINKKCNQNPGCVARIVLMYLGLIPTVRRINRSIFVSVDNKKIKDEYKEQYLELLDVPLYVNNDFSSIAHYSQHCGTSSIETTFGLRTLYVGNDLITVQEYRPVFSNLK